MSTQGNTTTAANYATWTETPAADAAAALDMLPLVNDEWRTAVLNGDREFAVIALARVEELHVIAGHRN